MEHLPDVTTPAFWAEQWRALCRNGGSPGGYRSAAVWNRMAAGYGANPSDGEDRLRNVFARLEQAGVDVHQARVLDIGCGPGEYAAAFVERGARVTCIDVAEKMIARLETELPAKTRSRITPLVADWRTLDSVSHGFERAFDLVFVNMTPGVAEPESFVKAMRASRRWCWFQGWAGRRRNSLMQEVAQTLADSSTRSFRGNFLYAYNLVCASGYLPLAGYRTVEWVRRQTIEEWRDYFATFFGVGAGEEAAAAVGRLQRVLERRAENGVIENRMSGQVGWMAWNIEEQRGGLL